MKKYSCSTGIRNLGKNAPLILSAIPALCLFMSPTMIPLAILLFVFVAITAACAFDVAKPPAVAIRYERLAAILLTILIAFMGISTFKHTWYYSSRVAALAGSFGLTSSTLIILVGLACCVPGAYAMYTLSRWIVLWIAQALKDHLPVRESAQIKTNLKKNWFFPISALAFFCLEFRMEADFLLGLLIILIGMLIVSSQFKRITDLVKGKPWYMYLFLAAGTAGICWCYQSYSYNVVKASSVAHILKRVLPFNVNIPILVSVICAVCATVFVFIFLSIFWTTLANILRKSTLRTSTSISTIVVCILLITVLIIGSSVVFHSSEAFYATNHRCELIYTSDSPMLLKGQVYLSITHDENDLRQPLFAVFAAPFIAVPYLLGRLLNLTYCGQVILINAAQIIMLVFANLMLAGMLKLSTRKTICFMILSSCTYMQLLAVLMIEQYIVAYFWLMLCMYLIAEKRQPDRIALWGTGSTLLTGMVLLPFMSGKSPIKNFKVWLKDMLAYGMEFLGLMLLMGRFDVLFDLTSKVSELSSFTGKAVPFVDKIKQYLAFVHGCIFTPEAGIDTTTFEYASWQLKPATGINVIGLAILALVVISAIWNRDKKSSRLAALWAGFSVAMLLGLGWGTEENGLILYALYFGWAFFVLLFQLVEKIEQKLNIKFLLPVFTVCAAAGLLVVNIPGIREMVDFAIAYYPA